MTRDCCANTQISNFNEIIINGENENIAARPCYMRFRVVSLEKQVKLTVLLLMVWWYFKVSIWLWCRALAQTVEVLNIRGDVLAFYKNEWILITWVPQPLYARTTFQYEWKSHVFWTRWRPACQYCINKTNILDWTLAHDAKILNQLLICKLIRKLFNFPATKRTSVVWH